jgi:membrane fusion protein, copper/silver efflux system
MRKTRVAVALMVIVAGAVTAGAWRSSAPAPAPSVHARNVLYYVDPMHPSYRSDKPGIAPDCGMQLVPAYADAEGEASAPSSPPMVQVAADKRQLVGIRTDTVEERSWTDRVRTTGRVVPDEQRVYRLTAAIDGWIQEVYPSSTGSLVDKDQPLAAFYSPEFLGAEQAYLYALGALDRFTQSGALATPEQIDLTRANIQTAADSLRNLGMGTLQLDELARTRKLTQNVLLRAPARSFVLARTITHGQRFERGSELYRVADLTRVWVLADIFEGEATYWEPGVRARVSSPAHSRVFSATVSRVLPQFDPEARTLKARLELDNPDFVLRPGMLLDVELPIRLASSAITVPSDAVLDTGTTYTVFVDHGDGRFEPRPVEIGARFRDRVHIVRGLMPGERIAVSGNFLLDSESRMRGAARPVNELAPNDATATERVAKEATTREADHTGHSGHDAGHSGHDAGHSGHGAGHSGH